MEKLKEKIEANPLNFIKDNYETTLRLSNVISNIFKDDILKSKLILKGGCAVASYLSSTKRLFFDIDFDYISGCELNFLEDKKIFYLHLLSFMNNLGYSEISCKSRSYYSLDSFKFPYNKITNNNLNYIKLEVNYSHGMHLYPCVMKNWRDDNFLIDSTVKVLSLEELLGVKIKDLFDVYNLLNEYQCDIEAVKKSYLFYYTLSKHRESPFEIENLQQMKKRMAIGGLYPLLSKDSGFCFEKIKLETIAKLRDILNFSKNELEFLKLFKDGYYHPELLFDDEEVINRARQNPIANYKMKLKQKR